VKILGISRLVRLGYRDSGMKGWPQNDDPESFWATPVDVAAAKLAETLMEERPQVIMTYNEHGFYGHPDHIQAHRITVKALEMIDYEPTLYFNAIPDSVLSSGASAGNKRTVNAPKPTRQGYRPRARDT